MEASRNITEALANIKKRIHNVCVKNHRDESQVKVLLATKTAPPEKIRVAMDAGFYLLGENKVQELKSKVNDPQLSQASWHFIGHLQTNKVKDILPHVEMIHSVDRMSLVEELQKQLTKLGRNLDILVQVNTSEEDSKFGLREEELIPFLEKIGSYDRLRVKGLMTLALFSDKEERVRPCFRKLRTLFEKAKSLSLPGVEMKELSMGMSGDFEMAIEEGATIVRLGTIVFGQRQLPDSHYWQDKT